MFFLKTMLWLVVAIVVSSGGAMAADYKKNPFTLVYDGAITENVKGAVNMNQVAYKLNGIDISANSAEAVSVILSAITAPTDRSIPPDKITTVIPAAMIALIETCRAMLRKLSAEKKFSVVRIITKLTATNPASGKK